MRDEQHGVPVLRQRRKRLAQIPHGLGVEPGARLVEHEHVGAVDERAGYERAACLAGREREHVALCQARDAELADGLMGLANLLVGSAEVKRHADAAKEAAEDDVEHGAVDHHAVLHARRDDPDGLVDLCEGSARVAAEHDGRFLLPQGEVLPREELDERGLARPVGAKDGHVLAFLDHQVVDVQDDVAVSSDLCVVQPEKLSTQLRSPQQSLFAQGTRAFLLARNLVERALAQANRLGRDLDELVVGNVLERLFERELDRRGEENCPPWTSAGCRAAWSWRR